MHLVGNLSLLGTGTTREPGDVLATVTARRRTGGTLPGMAPVRSIIGIPMADVTGMARVLAPANAAARTEEGDYDRFIKHAERAQRDLDSADRWLPFAVRAAISDLRWAEADLRWARSSSAPPRAKLYLRSAETSTWRARQLLESSRGDRFAIFRAQSEIRMASWDLNRAIDAAKSPE